MSRRTWALDEIQPGNPDFWTLPPADIDAAFAMLRRDSPVTFHEEFEVTPGMPIGPGFWSIVRHADVKMVGRQPQLFSSVSGVVIGDQTSEMDDFFGSMIGLDLLEAPPGLRQDHPGKRLLPPSAHRTARGDEVRGSGLPQSLSRRRQSTGEGGDFVDLFAVPFALQIICEMMGIPPADERRMFEITNVILGPSDPDCNVDFGQFIRDTKELFDYAIDLAKDRLAHPRDDIATTLVQAEVDGERLTLEEFARFTILLVIAGNDTTRTALSHGIKLLTDHPDQRRIWTHDFVGVAPTAVDEIVRVGTPTLHMRRRATVDTEIAGQPIKAGDKVVMWYYSANRDEAVYDDPLRFDVRRKGDLVGFGGGGPHYCIGAALARREMTVMFDEIFTTLPDLTVTGEPAMLQSNFIHGIKQLPCQFTPRSRASAETSSVRGGHVPRFELADRRDRPVEHRRGRALPERRQVLEAAVQADGEDDHRQHRRAEHLPRVVGVGVDAVAGEPGAVHVEQLPVLAATLVGAHRLADEVGEIADAVGQGDAAANQKRSPRHR